MYLIDEENIIQMNVVTGLRLKSDPTAQIGSLALISSARAFFNCSAVLPLAPINVIPNTAAALDGDNITFPFLPAAFAAS